MELSHDGLKLTWFLPECHHLQVMCYTRSSGAVLLWVLVRALSEQKHSWHMPVLLEIRAASRKSSKSISKSVQASLEAMKEKEAERRHKENVSQARELSVPCRYRAVR